LNAHHCTTASSKGQIILPAGIRELDGIRPGQRFEIERLDPFEGDCTQGTARL
jgi:AbrB family looped-hinge helix DNA binding protein